MNDELKTKEYLTALEQISLSDSSRARMKGELLEYVRFHSVVESSPVPMKTPFAWLLAKPVQMAFTFLFILGTSTALFFEYQKNGALIAPVEAPAPEVEHPVSGETTLSNPPHTDITPATPRTVSKNPLSEDVPSPDMVTPGARAKSAPETEAAFSDSAMMSTMVAHDAVNIFDYRADVLLREKTYRALITTYDTYIADDIRASLIAKLNTVQTLTTEAEGKSDDTARPLLDKAMTLIGEIESELSLLGAVTVENGIIIDIVFTTGSDESR